MMHNRDIPALPGDNAKVKIMALTNAQIQARYKQRHLNDETGTASRLDVLIDQGAKLALRRLAQHYGVNLRAILEGLIEAEQRQLLDTMSGVQQSVYYDAVRAG
jgi:hypothetical protein